MTRERIKRCRAAIRAHRDAKLDDRCWVDDYAVWATLEESPDITTPPVYEEAMKQCRAFYLSRRARTPDAAPPDAVTDPALWDADLETMTAAQLTEELARLQAAVRAHHGEKSHRIEHDRVLYHVLPEKIPADFRLPPEGEFLGEAKAPHAGCPSFWRSHAKCATACHNLHRWGPCERE